MKTKSTPWLYDLIIVILMVGLIIALSSCAPTRPGYKKTPTGWNTKEQKKRLKQHRKSHGSWRIEYMYDRPVPVTEVN